MSFDTSGLPISGGILLAAAAVVGTSLVMGQVMSSRMIDLSGWQTTCETDLVTNTRADLEAKRKPREIVPERRCSAEAGRVPPFFGDYRKLGILLCEEFGDPDLNKHAREAEKAARESMEEMDAQRLSRVAAKSGSQCSCAKTLYLQDNVIPHAVYAGSLRTISLPAVSNQHQELQQALHSPTCAVLMETSQ